MAVLYFLSHYINYTNLRGEIVRIIMIGQYLKKCKNASAPVKAAFWFTVCSIINKCIQLVTVPIFTRLLTTTEYGQYSVFVSWQNILLIIATLNIQSNVFNNGLLKYSNKQDEFLSSMQGLTTVITGCLIIIFLVFQSSLIKLIGLPSILVVVLLIEIGLTPGYELWAAKQRFDFKYRKIVLSTLLLVVLNPIVGLIFVKLANEKGYARILSVLIVQIFIYGFFYLYNFKKNRTFYNGNYWKYALLLATPLVPHYLSQTLLNQMDRIMISSICGDDKAGIYSVAYSGAMTMQIVGKAIQNSFTPWIYKKIKSGDISGIDTTVNALTYLIGGLNFILICFAPEAIYVLGGDKYMDAIYVIPPVTCGAFLVFLYSMFCNIEFYYEETKPMMIASIIGATVNFITNYICINLFGYYAAGYTTLFCYILFSIAHAFVMKKALKNNGVDCNIYDMKRMICFSIVFVVLGNAMIFTYKFFILRFSMIICILIIGLFKRKSFVGLFERS